MRRVIGCLKQTIGSAGLLTAAALVAPQAAHGLVINVTYDSTVTSHANGAKFQSAFNAVADAYENAITNNITVNVLVALGKVNTTAMGAGNAGESRVNAAGFTFASIKAAMSGTGAVLPATNPTGMSTILLPYAQYKALGLSGQSPADGYDGYIGFSSSLTFAFDDPLEVPSDAYDFRGVASHEISHVLGRYSSLSSGMMFYAYAADLFRYTAPGTSSFVYNTPTGGGTPAYASTDGGVTNLGTFADQTTGGDRVDWQRSVSISTRDAQTAVMEKGKDYCLSTSDQRFLMGLGYTFSAGAADLFISGDSCAPLGASDAAKAAVAAPEPASAALLATGGLMAGIIYRRRGRRTVQPA